MASRRSWLLAGAAAAGAWALRPADRGGAHDTYFAGLQRALRAAGIARPVVVVDRTRLQSNLDRIGAMAAELGLPLRVVVKSLPADALVAAALQRWRTTRAMVFNAAQLQRMALQHPQAALLLGKPLPAAAAQGLLAPLREALPRIEWLVDTPERLQQYRALAEAHGVTLRINLEIDVGLHRGGVPEPALLGTMLTALAQSPALQWSGLMGYDAHVAAVPDIGPNRERALAAAREAWQGFWQVAQAARPGIAREALTLNTGGSPTFHLHHHSGLPNEVAVGSAALKPADFDLPSLAALEPALFIATPLLKDLGPFRLPQGATLVSAAVSAWDINQRRGFAMHGGQWPAEVVSPPGLAPSGLFGASANQQVLVGSPSVALAPDELVFLRPRHSEAVPMLFGEIALIEQGRVVDLVPCFPSAA